MYSNTFVLYPFNKTYFYQLPTNSSNPFPSSKYLISWITLYHDGQKSYCHYYYWRQRCVVVVVPYFCCRRSCPILFIKFSYFRFKFNCTSNVIVLVNSGSCVVDFHIKESSIFSNKDVIKKHEVDVNYGKAWRVRELTLNLVCGCPKSSYALLCWLKIIHVGFTITVSLNHSYTIYNLFVDIWLLFYLTFDRYIYSTSK